MSRKQPWKWSAKQGGAIRKVDKRVAHRRLRVHLRTCRTRAIESDASGEDVMWPHPLAFTSEWWWD